MGLLKKKKKPLGKIRMRSGVGSGTAETSPFRPVHTLKDAPCMRGCPNGNQIREMLTTIAQAEELGKPMEQAYEEAFYVFAETQPFLSVCGRVCPHPCEDDCNRQHKDKSVAINNVERFLGDFALEKKLPVKMLTDEKRGEKIAVIGSGPAGLSAAYQLARRGYNVTVYEAFSKTGGMLRYGIPDYRLPPEILDAEVKRIEDLGVKIKCNTIVGKDISYEDLQKDYDAVFVGIGAHKGRLLGIPNEDAPNVYTGTEFLHRINAGELIEVGEKVLVIGGGDSAMDAARISKRLGADVTIVYRRTRNEMPAIEEDIVGGEEENIKFEFLTAPVKFEKEGEKIVKMNCQRMELGEPDESGRRRPVPIDGEFFDIDCSTVISAISQEPDFDNLDKLHEGRDWVKANEFGKTALDITWAGGDNLDLGLVIIAIYQGRIAAQAIDNNFNGIENKTDKDGKIASNDQIVFSYYEEKSRHDSKHVDPEVRIKDLNMEIDSTLGEVEAIEETRRCLSCGDCFDCGTCWSLCQDNVFIKPPTKTFEPYKMKLDVCKGCNKCAESCPCGFIEMRDPVTGEYAKIERIK